MGEWGELLTQLKALGVNDARKAVATARKAGLDVADVEAIVGYWSGAPGKWGPGALYYRLMSAVAGQRPDEGWPPPAASAARREKSAAKSREEIRSAKAFAIITEGRRNRKSDDEIMAELKAKGLEWP